MTTKDGSAVDNVTDQEVNHEQQTASRPPLPASISVASLNNLCKNKRSRDTQEDRESTEITRAFDNEEGNSKRQKHSCEHWYVWITCGLPYEILLFYPTVL